jgi:hypothetical protein
MSIPKKRFFSPFQPQLWNYNNLHTYINHALNAPCCS